MKDIDGWYFIHGGETKGPISYKKLIEVIDRGLVVNETEVRHRTLTKDRLVAAATAPTTSRLLAWKQEASANERDQKILETLIDLRIELRSIGKWVTAIGVLVVIWFVLSFLGAFLSISRNV